MHGMDQNAPTACGLANLHLWSYCSTDVFSFQCIVVEYSKLRKSGWVEYFHREHSQWQCHLYRGSGNRLKQKVDDLQAERNTGGKEHT